MPTTTSIRLATASAVLWALLPTPFLPGPAESVVAEPVDRLLTRIEGGALGELVDAVAELPDALRAPGLDH